MPLPTPKKNEKKPDFVARCMGSAVVKRDFKTRDQRLAVCYRQWNKRPK